MFVCLGADSLSLGAGPGSEVHQDCEHLVSYDVYSYPVKIIVDSAYFISRLLSAKK
jgi:hypothetical protein